ncbi:uncharacterized protein SOCE836_079910 [Sorangium cellulosum]|uniref:Transposase n=1 Tax=Sorangium cellulosum TaxID=56 RepID=A0A4V0NH85_SORCE|nr:uncharacterized protein SOCE836_079910 [Sorangium cellulosum]
MAPPPEASLRPSPRLVHRPRLVEREAWLRATPSSVVVYADDEVMARHDRRGAGLRSTLERHLPEEHAGLRHRRRAYWEQRADHMGQDVGRFVRQVFDAEDVLSQLRKVQAIVTHLESSPQGTRAAERAITATTLSLLPWMMTTRRAAAGWPVARSSTSSRRHPNDRRAASFAPDRSSPTSASTATAPSSPRWTSARLRRARRGRAAGAVQRPRRRAGESWVARPRRGVRDRPHGPRPDRQNGSRLGRSRIPARTPYLPFHRAARSSRQGLESVRISAERTLDVSEHRAPVLTRSERGSPAIRLAGLGAIRWGGP